jgi:hypothetical protein
MEKGDYLICKRSDNPKKNFLVQVSNIKDKEIDCLIEKDRHLEEEEMTIYPHHILINLGPRPHPELKTIAGVDVRDVYRKTINHDIWGPIHFLSRPERDSIDVLKKSLDKTGDRLCKMGFHRLFNFFCVEVRSPRKDVGMYRHKHGPKKINRLQLFLSSEHEKEMNYILYHEFGHALRFNVLTEPRVYSSWIGKFNTSIQVDSIASAEFTRLMKMFIKADVDKCSEFYSSLQEEREKLVFKQAIRLIQKIHRVGPREIDALLSAGKADVVEDLWPEKDVDKNELNPIVSEYACKNPEELFAEAFSFSLVGKKLPKSVGKLLDKTLSYAKDRIKKIEEPENKDDSED